MRRLLLALLLVTPSLTAWADNDELTLKRVMLSSGGVGYFEFAADVDGDAVLGLDVPIDQVDDILKSLVVFDTAGSIAGVELPGRDNTVKAFGDAPFGPEALESPMAYLNALRGTEVTVQGPRPMTGRIVRAEPITETIDTGNTQRTRVTVLSAEGLRQFVLEDAETVQITDPALRARVEQALESLRRDAGTTTRHLTIRLKGTGERAVSIGYVVGAPLWKATYRLVTPSDGAPTARLQGWATLENQSGTDWKDVTLTLQYGNPVTFRQALYRSYFVQRPEVPIEILGHVLPDIDTRARGMAMPATTPAPAPPPMLQKSAGMPAGAAVRSEMAPAMAPPADAAQTIESAEETTFTLAQPVDLAAGHSANVPILDRQMPASKIGLVPFQAPHPLASIRMNNDSKTSLPAGVLTLYDSGDTASFAGDARLGGLPIGETRLLSFARDLRTTIDTKQSAQPNTVTLFRVVNGTLFYTVRNRAVIDMTATAPATGSRDLLLEIPKYTADSTLTLQSGKATIAEQTEGAFRIALPLSAGETRSITVWRDQPSREGIALIGNNTAVETVIADLRDLKPAERAALDHIVDLRRDEAAKQAAIARQNKLLADVQTDEDRVRKNLEAVTSADPLRARLVRALDADETKIDQLRKAIDDAQNEADKAHAVLADAVAALRI